MQRYTCPPYYLTFKENGCIIFVAALSDTELVVTSKHGLGQLNPNLVSSASAQPADDRGEDEEASPDFAQGGQSVSHAQKGAEWLDRHLAKGQRTRPQLAAELWKRGETAIFELCDDAFEEHVLAYDQNHAGLYLHGLNKNTVQFATCTPEQVDAFARDWGFHSTRFLTLESFEAMQRVVARVALDGMWEGQPIEGFVVRTTIPASAPTIADVLASEPDAVVRPPYETGQTWFYKVKFDEPYLMYRDWRELARRMLSDQVAWTKEYGKPALQLLKEGGRNALQSKPVTAQAIPVAALEDEAESQKPSTAGDGEAGASPGQSKKAAKRQARARWNASQRLHQHAETGGRRLPAKPKPKTRRPETILFLEWCYEQLWGTPEGQLPRPELFTHFAQGKGIIRLRDEFLAYCSTPEGKARLPTTTTTPPGAEPTDASAISAEAAKAVEPTGPFTHTLIVPISVPGSGKTTLARALGELYPSFGHPQSDMLTGKRSKAAQFLSLVLQELKDKKVVFADRNNHLFKHRSELVELVHQAEQQGWTFELAPPRQDKKKGKKQTLPTPPPAPAVAGEKPRVRLVALHWTFGSLRHWEIKQLMCSRIVARGQNHPSLKADVTSPRGQVEHERIVSIFLNQRQAFEPKAQPLVPGLGVAETDSSVERKPDWADGIFHDIIPLDISAPLEENLVVLLELLHSIDPTFPIPAEQDRINALLHAHQVALSDKDQGKAPVATAEEDKKGGKKKSLKPRYFGINLPDLDLSAFLRPHLASTPDAAAFLAQLQDQGGFVVAPHVTLVHQNQVRQEEDAVRKAREQDLPEPDANGTKTWAHLLAALEAAPVEAVDGERPNPVLRGFSVAVTGLVWSQRAMTLTVGTITHASFNWNLHLASDWIPHITVGTAEGVRPLEGRVLAAAYRTGALPADARAVTFTHPVTIEGQLEGMVA